MQKPKATRTRRSRECPQDLFDYLVGNLTIRVEGGWESGTSEDDPGNPVVRVTVNLAHPKTGEPVPVCSDSCTLDNP